MDVIEKLLLKWSERYEAGKPVSAATLCKKQPELTSALEKEIARLMLVEDRLQSLRHESIADSSPAGQESPWKPGVMPVEGYVLVRKIGSGGSGEIWEARAPGGMPIALKLVQLAHPLGKKERKALRLMKEVGHANLLTIFASWVKDDWLVVATELAHGSLMDLFKKFTTRTKQRPGLTLFPLLEVMLDAARGVDHLREAYGLMHHDIKPQNIFLFGPSAKIGDFGLVKSFDNANTRVSLGGTRPYVAPELFNGTVSGTADQFSLAVTYCEARDGRRPFDDADEKKRSCPDLDMVPQEEREAVRKALSIEPDKRYLSCQEFVLTLGETFFAQRKMIISVSVVGRAKRIGPRLP